MWASTERYGKFGKQLAISLSLSLRVCVCVICPCEFRCAGLCAHSLRPEKNDLSFLFCSSPPPFLLFDKVSH